MNRSLFLPLNVATVLLDGSVMLAFVSMDDDGGGGLMQVGN